MLGQDSKSQGKEWDASIYYKVWPNRTTTLPGGVS